MKKTDSSMPLDRQLRYQKQCRENWKENAAAKQEKIREYVQSTRALKKSRDSWKARAKAAELQVKQLKKQLAQLCPNFSDMSSVHSDDLEALDDEDTDIIPHHHYRVTTIRVVVQQFINVGNSFRGVAKTMQLISSYSELGTPHYSSVKAWMERMGLYELIRPKEKRNDWLFIADLTVELGKEKAFVIYGVSNHYWQTHRVSHRRGLKPTDGQILAIEVTEKATGEWIYDVLQSVSEQVGTPLQIISDRAPNLYKGIQLFTDQHPGVVSTYDVTHAMANLLKKQLSSDEVFQNFLTDCHYCRQLIQQTELAFAAPPGQRSQCRYFNLEKLVNWASQILKSNFAFFSRLLPQLTFYQLWGRLEEKLAWLEDYIEPIRDWKHLIFMTRTLEKQLKTFGLNRASIYHYCSELENQKIPHFLAPFKQQILTYLEEQISFSPDRTILATSDILESIFGRYKYFSSRCPIKELRSLLLTIPLSTINFTNQFVKKALMTVHSADLSQWIQEVFGQSNLSKRKILFSH